MITIGKRVKEIRNRYGLSQEKFAESLNTYRIRIVRIENDQIQPTFQEIVNICDKYNTDIEIFIIQKSLSTRDFKKISDRYVNNRQLTYEERRDTIENLYISLAQSHLKEIYSNKVTNQNEYIKNDNNSNKINIEMIKEK